MTDNKYPTGYKNKVDYYQDKINEAIEELDTAAVKHYAEKLVYFVAKQHIWRLELIAKINQK